MKKFLLIICSIFISLTSYAQSQLWGMTSLGGQYGAGVIFKTDGSGNNETVQQNYLQPTGINPYQNNLIQASDGKFYGMITDGGANNSGVIFQYDPATFTYINKYDFTGTGGNPQGSLIQALDGNLYGMTQDGGANGLGVLFQFNPITSSYTDMLDFAGATNGSNPFGSLMQASNGMLYGMTQYGGANGLGVLFQFNPATSIYTKQLDFAGTANGSNPFGTLMQASNGMLYGMTEFGGLNGDGVLFQFDPATSIFTKQLDFAGTTNGSSPLSSLMQATDGMLYGMTYQGGVNDLGALFQFNPVTSSYTKMFDFTEATGDFPQGSLMQASDGEFYGTAAGGGANGDGVLFQFNPATVTYTDVFDFVGVTTGGNPRVTLMQALDGKLYGMTTTTNGLNGDGVLFQFDPATSIYNKQFDFSGGNGGYPIGSLMEASNGKLYGMTEMGGAADLGALFQFDPTTSTYSKQVDFIGTVNGSYPRGDLMQAMNGKLYGMTSDGGANSDGVLFQFDPNTSVYTDEFDFTGTVGGGNPKGALIQASNGKLYGMTQFGGANNSGVLFQFDPTTDIYTKQFDFVSATGASPNGSLIQASDGKLYGMTTNGGVDNMGVIFQFDPSTSTYTDMLDFIGTNGSYPISSLIQASNGKLYGMAQLGGANNMGLIFQFDPATSTFTDKIDFAGATNGSIPFGSLIQASDGNLYGMTKIGGANADGVLFQFNPTTSTYTKKLDFNGANGQSPVNTNLIEIAVTIQTASVGTTNCVGNSVSVPYTIAGAYDAGNVFTAQLSDASGSFALPVSIGNISAVNAGSVNATIPVLTTPGSGYRIRVVSSNPVITGIDNGSNIAINALPIVTASATVSTLCKGSSTKLSGGGAETYVWSGGIINSISFVPDSTTTYTVTGTDSHSCINTATKTITVDSLPTVTANATVSTLCAGGSTKLSGGGALSYVWSNGVTNSVAFKPISTTTYTVTGTGPNSCTNTATTTITVDSLPTVTANATISTLCAGDSTTLSGGGALSYVWSGGITDGISFKALSTVTYTVTGKDINSCTNTAAKTITVNALPIVTANATFSPICAGDSTKLFGGGALSYVWSGGITNDSSFVPASTTTYTVTGTDSNSCINTATKTIIVDTIPPVPTISITGSTLKSSATTGNQWYLGGAIIPGAVNQTYPVTANGTYTVEITNTGCASVISSPFKITNVGVSEVTNPEMFSVYPNPSDGNMTILFDASIKGTYEMEVINVLGQVLLREILTDDNGKYTKQLSLAEFGKGLYIISLTNDKQQLVKKVIVN